MLIFAMVIAGFAIPSPGLGSAGPLGGGGSTSDYHALGTLSAPEELIVPDIDLKAPVLPIEIAQEGDERVLTPPSDYHEVGYWVDSAKPGSPSGQTVITGHTVHTGGGVMNRLGEMRPGALVQIKTKAGTLDYVTTKVFVYTKQQLSDHSEQLFSQKRADNRLVLVTCTGWTGSYYTSNIIVFADPLGVRNSSSPSPSPSPSPSGVPAKKKAA
ncbi:MAG TPA: class F sortase [Marmoricola sp.]|nr:class F sortase [Marmoricola sp.]